MGLLSGEWDSQSREWARKLASVTRAKPVILSWAKELHRLKNEDGHAAEVVEEALLWYCQHFGQPYVPQCLSASSFRAKFTQVLAAMKRELPEPEEQDKKLSWKLLDRLHPPDRLVPSLPGIICLTRQNWERFLRVIQEKACPNNCTTRDLAFLGRLLSYYAPLFIENWLVYSLLERRDIHGPEHTLAFAANSPRFRDVWRRWAFEWSGSACAFDCLLEELLKGACRESGRTA